MALREMLLRLDVQVDRAAEQKANRAINGLTEAARGLAGIFVGGAITRGFLSIIEDASAAEEAANKFGAVFGDAADSVSTKLVDIAERTKQGNLQIQQFTSSIGALIKPALGSAEAAGEISTNIAELAFDIASFNDVRPEEALIALRSGLIGSAEPLQRFGVDVRVAAIEQEALAQGITKSNKQLTEAERIQLRFSAITRQLTSQGAVGDAAKTADSYANAVRGLRSQFTDLRAEIGALVLPAVNRVIVVFRTLVEFFRQDLRTNLIILGSVFASLAVPALASAAAVVAAWTAAALPFILIGLLIGLLLDDLVAFATGGQSAIGLLQESILEFLDSGTAVADFFRIMTETARFSINTIGTILGGLASIIVSLFQGDLTQAGETAFSILEELGANFFDSWSRWIESVTRSLGRLLEFAEPLTSFVGDTASSVGNAVGGLFGGGNAAAAATNNRSFVNSPSTDISITVNASGDANSIATAVGDVAERQLGDQLRDMRDAVAVGAQ